MLKKFACGAYLARGPAPSTPDLKNIDDFEGGRAKKRGKRRCFQGVSKWSSTSLLGQASAISRGGKRSSTVPKTKIAALLMTCPDVPPDSGLAGRDSSNFSRISVPCPGSPCLGMSGGTDSRHSGRGARAGSSSDHSARDKIHISRRGHPIRASPKLLPNQHSTAPATLDDHTDLRRRSTLYTTRHSTPIGAAKQPTYVVA